MLLKNRSIERKLEQSMNKYKNLRPSFSARSCFACVDYLNPSAMGLQIRKQRIIVKRGNEYQYYNVG
jgi:hypothetical protein